MLHFFHPGGKANHITFIIASGIDVNLVSYFETGCLPLAKLSSIG